MYWIARGRLDALHLEQAVRDVVAGVDSGVAASGARRLDEVWAASLAPRRISVRLFRVFSDAAMALCAIGVYGVAAFSARARRREIAIRAAVGAGEGTLVRSLLRRELTAVILGLGAGLLAAFMGAPRFAGALFETDPRDAMTFVEAFTALLAVAALASYLPLRQVARMNPAEVLHA
jgi:hypothetical protein